jgi:hypothetical protein
MEISSSLRVPPKFLDHGLGFCENSAALQTIENCLPKVDGKGLKQVHIRESVTGTSGNAQQERRENTASWD